MRRKSFKHDLCPAARSLDSIGEWWSLLIVRNALFGMRRFSDFQEDLGLAKNILSARLKKLVACGIMEHVPASDGSVYQEYVLTKKGRDLLPVIVALRQWGENYLFSRGERSLQIVDKVTRKPPRRLNVQAVRNNDPLAAAMLWRCTTKLEDVQHCKQSTTFRSFCQPQCLAIVNRILRRASTYFRSTAGPC
jgi:DNA-binding HxlR family transcriptional regulator